MAKKKVDTKTQPQPSTSIPPEDSLTRLQRHYLWGVQDMDTRRVRKNGWNDIINAYMGKLPPNWPYNSVVTDPRIRTTIVEKTSRLLNAKLQGRLVPRNEKGDYIKALINNFILSFQWDYASEGGSMLEKCALTDQYARIFGCGFVLNYWDAKRSTNEIKLLDPRDMFFDGAASHVKNARWVQVREFTTFDKLEQRGYDVSKARDMAANGEITAELRSTRYESIVKANRGLMDRTGMVDDLQNPVVEVVTEYGYDKDQTPYMDIWLPKYAMLVDEKEGDSYPYKHGKIPINMLRYYPLNDDIYGESEVEAVIPIQRGINAMLCGFIDECNIKLRPPLKINPSQARVETIEYGPGAKWIVNDQNAIQEHQSNDGFIASFNAVYPTLITAFNSAMGDQSQFNNQIPGKGQNPTATQVVSDEKQQNVRDQYNQLYLSEFLRDVMMMWLENNKQYMFDDPTKKFQILRIVGKDHIQELQAMQLDQSEIPPYAMRDIANTVMTNPQGVTNDNLQQITQDVSMPTNPVVLNPNEEPENFDIKNKLDVSENGKEADLYITQDDFEGEYDYIPDVRAMAAGAGIMQQQARQKAYDLILNNPQVTQQLQMQGQQINIKELLVNLLEDSGEKDAESLFQPSNNGQPQQQPGQPLVPGQGASPPGSGAPQPPGLQGVPGLSQAVPGQAVNGGIPQAGQGAPGLH